MGAETNPLPARRDPVPLVALRPWRVTALIGPAPGLVLAFSSIGHDPARVPGPEFLAAATAGGRSALFIADESRSWTTAPGFAEMLARAMAAAQARGATGPVLALGQSMGGFAALVAGTHLALDAVLAIGPQAGIGAAAPAGEARWRDWTRDLPALAAPLPCGPAITLLHGLADDRAQALAFPRRAGVDHLLFPGLSHSGLGLHLKARGCLAGLVEAALARDRRRLLRIAGSAGGVSRARWERAQDPR